MLLIKEPSSAGRLEIVPTIGEVADQLNSVDKWSKPTKPPFSLTFAAMRPLIRHEAKGTVLIISPFNYPIWLSIGPLVRIPSLSLSYHILSRTCRRLIVIIVCFRLELSRLVTPFA